MNEEFRVGLRENQRGTELDDVVMGAVGAREDAAIAKAIDDVGRLQRRRVAGVAIENEIDSQKKPRAAYIADQLVALLQGLQAIHQVSAYPQGVRLQLLIFEDIQDR